MAAAVMTLSKPEWLAPHGHYTTCAVPAPLGPDCRLPNASLDTRHPSDGCGRFSVTCSAAREPVRGSHDCLKGPVTFDWLLGVRQG
jgi:hypothetical protein